LLRSQDLIENSNTQVGSSVDNNKNNQTSNSIQPVVNPQNYTLSKNGLLVDIQVQSKRNDGYCRKVILKNTNEDKKVINWQIKFNLNKKLDSSWSANFVQNGSTYIVDPKTWNKEIQP